jgi:tetratricopeptide (TPR) repeat protein
MSALSRPLAVAVFIGTALVAGLASSQGRGAQPAPPGGALAEVLQRPVPLRANIGQAHETVTTASKTAQAYYDQGLAYLHSFVWLEAARSFNEALRADPSVALAHVGLSYALGELGDGAGARAAAGRAQAVEQKASDLERVRIGLRLLQLEVSASPADSAAGAKYQKQLASALDRFPNDVELLLLVGRAQDPSHAAHGMAAGRGAIAFYERALKQAPDYFAIHHYLTHAYENINRPDRALAHAATFARLASAIPHAHHMHGHVLRRVGRMGDALDAFKKADDLGSQYLTAERIAPEYDWHYRHNLDLLGTSHQYLGQMRAAEAVLRRAFDMPATARVTEELNRREWPAFLLSRGRPQDALAAAASLGKHPLPLVRALADIVASRALSALKRPEEAAEAGNRALRQMRSAGPTGGVLVPDFQLAQGEHLMRSGQSDAARSMLRDTAAKLRAQSGPDAWVQTLFALESVGRLARERGDWTLAAEMADAMRSHDPDYPGTWYAAALVAEHRGARDQALDGFRQAAQRWASADPDFAELLDARRRLGTPARPSIKNP